MEIPKFSMHHKFLCGFHIIHLFKNKPRRVFYLESTLLGCRSVYKSLVESVVSINMETFKPDREIRKKVISLGQSS